MYNSQVCDEIMAQCPSKPAMNAGEGKCATEDEDEMRPTACSTEIFSEMGTLESIPTSSHMSFFEDPLLEEIPKTKLPTTHSVNGGPGRHAALTWQGMTSRSAQSNAPQKHDSPIDISRFNFRKSQMRKTGHEKQSEEATTATEEDEIEFERRPVEFIFRDLRKTSDVDFGFNDDYDDLTSSSGDASLFDTHEVPTPAGKVLERTKFIGVSMIDEEACFEAPDLRMIMSNDADPHKVPSKDASALDSYERSNTMHEMPDMSLGSDSSIMVGAPGRALRKKRVVASLK